MMLGKMLDPNELSQRDGKYYLHWIANCNQNLKPKDKRSLCNSNLNKLCFDVKGEITRDFGSPIQFSLRRSAELVNGLVKLYNVKLSTLLEEVSALDDCTAHIMSAHTDSRKITHAFLQSRAADLPACIPINNDSPTQSENVTLGENSELLSYDDFDETQLELLWDYEISIQQHSGVVSHLNAAILPWDISPIVEYNIDCQDNPENIVIAPDLSPIEDTSFAAISEAVRELLHTCDLNSETAFAIEEAASPTQEMLRQQKSHNNPTLVQEEEVLQPAVQPVAVVSSVIEDDNDAQKANTEGSTLILENSSAGQTDENQLENLNPPEETVGVQSHGAESSAKSEWSSNDTYQKIRDAREVNPAVQLNVHALLQIYPDSGMPTRFVAAKCFMALIQLCQEGHITLDKDADNEIININIIN